MPKVTSALVQCFVTLSFSFLRGPLATAEESYRIILCSDHTRIAITIFFREIRIIRGAFNPKTNQNEWFILDGSFFWLKKKLREVYPPSALMILLCAERAYITFCYSAVPITGNDFPVIGSRSLQARDMLANHSAGRRCFDASNTAADERAPSEDHDGRNEQQTFSTARGPGEDNAEEDEPETGSCEQCSRHLPSGSRGLGYDDGGKEIRVRGNTEFIVDMVAIGVRDLIPFHIKFCIEIPLVVCRVPEPRLARGIVALRRNSGAADLHGNNLLIRVIGRDIEAVAVLTGLDRAGSCSTRSSRA
jgi:hypothetical protein